MRKDYNAKVQEARAHTKERYSPLIGIFNGPLGKSALKVLEEDYANRTTFVPGDPYQSAFLEGQRSVILTIHELLNLVEEQT